MGQTLTVADEKQAYTISDKATFLAHEDSLSMLLEETDDMKNTYSMIVVTAERFADSNVKGAQAFVDWIATDEARQMIAEYGKAEYGEACSSISIKNTFTSRRGTCPPLLHK